MEDTSISKKTETTDEGGHESQSENGQSVPIANPEDTTETTTSQQIVIDRPSKAALPNTSDKITSNDVPSSVSTENQNNPSKIGKFPETSSDIFEPTIFVSEDEKPISSIPKPEQQPTVTLENSGYHREEVDVPEVHQIVGESSPTIFESKKPKRGISFHKHPAVRYSTEIDENTLGNIREIHQTIGKDSMGIFASDEDTMSRFSFVEHLGEILEPSDVAMRPTTETVDEDEISDEILDGSQPDDTITADLKDKSNELQEESFKSLSEQQRGEYSLESRLKARSHLATESGVQPRSYLREYLSRKRVYDYGPDGKRSFWILDTLEPKVLPMEQVTPRQPATRIQKTRSKRIASLQIARPCGGSHTTTATQQRGVSFTKCGLPSKQHLSRFLMGRDGQLYKGAIPAEAKIGQSAATKTLDMSEIQKSVGYVPDDFLTDIDSPEWDEILNTDEILKKMAPYMNVSAPRYCGGRHTKTKRHQRGVEFSLVRLPIHPRR